ncbi:outer membrane beta-barrel protein [Niabella ginsengisoli]|uniref:PorT family protein n=1 Tax=Niabella ginsengisoli TaxID=522298 RepID=A0ABS9SRE3_9BACT|nr:outer membrane beta-barrel protein [Niabella ginsengisoli]MCH5600937.1 PorT family protein [Niabella ginsengisoli]
MAWFCLNVIKQPIKPYRYEKNIQFNRAFLGITIAGQAQGFAVSDKVMIGHSWTVGNRNDEDLKRAFHPTVAFGRSIVYNFSDNVGIGLGTFFSTEGGSFKIDNDSEAKKAEQRMNYIRIPLGAMFTFGDPANKVRPRLGIGGSVGFLVGGKTYFVPF